MKTSKAIEVLSKLSESVAAEIGYYDIVGLSKGAKKPAKKEIKALEKAIDVLEREQRMDAAVRRHGEETHITNFDIVCPGCKQAVTIAGLEVDLLNYCPYCGQRIKINYEKEG